MTLDNPTEHYVKTQLEWASERPDAIFGRLSDSNPDTALAFVQRFAPPQPAGA